MQGMVRVSKKKTLLKELPSSISIIFYQDAFEVLNPLGCGKETQAPRCGHDIG